MTEQIKGNNNIVVKDNTDSDITIQNFYKSLEYKELKERIEEMRDFMQSTTDEVKRLKYSQKLNELESQLEAFKLDIIQLYEAFQKTNIDNEIIQLARQKFDEGKFKEARSLLETEQITNGLDVLLERKEKVHQDLKDKAEELLLLARLTTIDYSLEKDRFPKAKIYFKKSIKAHKNELNLFAYAHFLQQNGKLQKATSLYEEVLEIRQNLAITNPQTYLPYVARTLNNLTILHFDENELDKAEIYAQKAYDIYRDLLDLNEQMHISEFAGLLNNLANIYQKKNQLKKAEKTYENAINIIEKSTEDVNSELGLFLNNLAITYDKQNKLDKAEITYKKAIDVRKKIVKVSTYPPSLYIGITLNNLGTLYNRQKEFIKAENAHTEALTIFRNLLKVSPQAIYSGYVAGTLSNLGVLYRTKDELDKAEKVYIEALKIDRTLAKFNKKTYLPNVANTLNNLANLYSDKDEFEKGLEVCEEALEIRSNLAELNPETFLPSVAQTQGNLGNLYRYLSKYDEAEDAYKKAISIYRDLVKIEPDMYLPLLGIIQLNLSLFYQHSKIDKILSLKLLDESMKILLPLYHIPYIEKYIKSGVHVLNGWDIDPEIYFEEKLKF